MGMRHENNSDRLRTIWTPEMDRCFIDLMLDQVEKGNRIDDHLFSKRAWKHMTSLFNARFKFNYEKDVLKNRHKTLRNMYKAINNLLAQNGFSWDRNRQMVTADNKLWDDYIKVHPEARSYRVKTLPYYCDLCKIYKSVTVGNAILVNDETDGVGEADLEALHEIMIDEDFRVSITNEFEEEDMGLMRSRTYWQPPMDRYFIDLMVDQVQKGNQIDGLIRKQAWVEMVESFNARFGFKYDVDILKNRYKTLRRQYNVIKKLLEVEGFFWDDTRQMVIGDDRVWQDYIEANSDARQYMTRPVPYYKDLCIICKQVNADGRYSFSNHHSNGSESSASSTDDHAKRKLENQWGSKENLKKAKINDEHMVSALREMATAVSCLRKEDSIGVENVVESIQALPDMDEDLILDACDLLEDEKKAKTFLALDVKLRRKWLIRKLRPQCSS